MILSPSRLGAILRKEFIQMRRDRVTFAMMLIVPLMQLLLFGFAINNDPRHLPTALVAPVQDRFTQAMSTALEVTGYFDITHANVTAEEADRLLARGDVSFVILIPPDFGRRILRGDRPQLLVEADASDPAASSVGSVRSAGWRMPSWRRSSAKRRRSSSRSSPTAATIPKASCNTISFPACSASSCR